MVSERDAVKGKILVNVAAVTKGEGNNVLLIWECDTPYTKTIEYETRLWAT